VSTAASPTALGAIGQIALTVQDLPRAVAFYRDALGLTPLPIEAPTLAFFDCAGIRLMLALPEGNDGRTGGAALYFRVGDIHDAYRTLGARGVAFLGEPHRVARLPDHQLWMAFFRDPAGNLLALMSEVRP